jgi:hypothetical protein
MTANTKPIFALTPQIGLGVISTANTNRDGTGTIVSIFTAGLNGAHIDKIKIKAQGTTTAGIVMLFLLDGTNTRLWQEIVIDAITPSTSVASFEITLTPDNNDDMPLILPDSWTLGAAPQKTETFNIIAQPAGDF